MSGKFRITINGRPVWVAERVSVAAAMMMANEPCRHSVSQQHRAAFCGMGICMECCATVNGVDHCRTCQMNLQSGDDGGYGMTAGFDVVVAGAGPGGMAAATTAAEAGRKVCCSMTTPHQVGRYGAGFAQRQHGNICTAEVFWTGAFDYSGRRARCGMAGARSTHHVMVFCVWSATASR